MANLFGFIDLSKLLCCLCALQIVSCQSSTLTSVAQVRAGGLGSQKTVTAAPLGAPIVAPVASNNPAGGAAAPARSTVKPPPTTTFAGYLPGSPYPFVLPPPDIPYFGSKWNGPWGYPIGHYQAFRGTGQYITHYSYYPLSYFGSLMAPFAYGVSGKK